MGNGTEIGTGTENETGPENGTRKGTDRERNGKRKNYSTVIT